MARLGHILCGPAVSARSPHEAGLGRQSYAANAGPHRRTQAWRPRAPAIRKEAEPAGSASQDAMCAVL